ncbi:hypothetical protein [Halogranum gelatinilyticum]|uniref:hypothetical protein n=1 Tax=Halogranum gelatinilyticum TaxID=660521 RepID=UPI001113D264|nr:hypothetical protein [Halogranum gelatinilyticum]
MRRRDYVTYAFGALPILSGCSSNPNNHDFSIDNSTGSAKQVTVEVSSHGFDNPFYSDGFDDPFYSETVGLSPDEKKSYSEVITEAGRYRIRVVVPDQFSETYAWWADESPYSSLYVDIEANSIEFREISR